MATGKLFENGVGWRDFAATDIPASGVTAATYGDATHVGQFTVAANGTITAASSVAITGGGGGDFSLICDQLLSGTQASFDTNTILGGNVPGSFKHLRLAVYGRSDTADTNTPLRMQFNGDTTSGDYLWANLFTVAQGTPSGLGGGPDTAFTVGNIPAANATAGYFSHSMADIANYAQTTGAKGYTAQAFMVRSNTNSNIVSFFQSGMWTGTAAVTRIVVFPGAGSFVAGSRFTLYGLA